MFTRATAQTPLELKSAIAREPLIVSPDTTVRSAIAQMSGMRSLCATTKTADSQLDELHLEVRSSCVLVVENERLLGILTERDVVRLIAQQQPLDRLVMQQVMAHPVVTLRESDFTDLFFATNLLLQHHIRHLPMLDEHDRLVGLVTHESLRQISRPIDLLRLRMVADVMTTEVIVATPDCHLRAIAQLMANHRISSVMIVEQSSSSTEPLQIPLGIVTERDMVQFQALGLNLDNCTAEAVMSTPIFAVKPEDSLWNVQQIMDQRLIRRLAVTGERGELLGIVTQTSLLQALNPLELYKLVEVLDSKVVQLEAEKVALLENRNVELEQQVQARTVALETKAKQERLLNTIADHIRSSLNLQEILDTTVREIRSLLGCDRVIIYRFRPNFRATVIAEAITGTGRSVLNTEAHDPCISAEWLEPYRNGKIRIIDDIYNEAMTECHQELLVGFDIRTQLMVPIVVEEQLWGLMLASYRAVPHTWTNDEIELIRQVSLQVAIALQQATTHERLQKELTKRWKVEVLLLESEQRYATLVTAAPVGIFRTDAAGKFTYINDRYCQISGLTTESTIGKEWQQGLHPDDRDWVTAEWEQLVQENHPFQLEYRFQHPDGKVIWVYGQAVAERDANGQTQGYVGTVTDISDRKLTETQLLESEERYATLVEAATVGIFRTDTGGNCIYANDRWCELSGLTLKATIGKGWQQAVYPDDRVAIATEAQQSMEENRPFQLEYRFQRPDGTVTWVYGQSVSELDSDGQVVGYVGTLTDITDRKNAEQQLQQLNQELETKIAERTQELWQVNNLQRAILDGTDYSIISTDQTGIIQTFNAGAERMLGYSAAEMVGKATPELIHDRQEVINRATSLSQELKQNITPGLEVFVAKARQGIVTEEEWTYISKNGSRFPVLLSTTALKDANQQIIGFVGISKDITDRKCAEQKRQQLVQELSAFKSALDESAIVAITDAKGVITYVNDRFCEISGYFRDQALGQTHRIVNSGYHPPSFFQDMWRTIVSGGVWRGEICNRAKNGSLYWVASTIVPFVDEQGRPFQYLSIRFDITDRKFAETRLQQENTFRQQIVENMAEGLCVCYEIEESPLVRFTVWNQQMQAITGYSLEEINRLGWYQRLYPDPEVQAQAIARTGRMRQGDNLIAEEWEIQRQDGQQRTIAISTSVLSSEDGLRHILALIQDITDRRQTEQENRLLKQRLQFLLASSPAMIYSCKPYGDYGATFMSENIQAILGYQPEEFLTKSNFWASHIHPDDAPRIFAEIPALFDDDIHNHEYRFLHGDGHYIWLRDEMRLVRDTEGNPLEIIGYFADISDRKQVEKELQESQAKFQRLVDDIGDKFVVFSHRGTSGLLTYLSDGVASVFGLGKQDVIGKPWMDSIDWLPEDVEIAHSSVIQMVENQVDFLQFDMRFIHPDGGQRTISVSQHPVRDQAGNAIAIEGIVEDITDRKRAEAELKQVSERLTLSLKSGEIGCWEWNIVQNTVLWDERMYELYGVTKQLETCVVYDIWANTLHPDDRIPTETLVQQALLGQAEYDTEFRVIHPDGSLHFIKAYGVLVRDAQGKPQRMIGVNFDISDLKQAEQMIKQQAQRERLLREITQRVRQSLDLQTIFDTATQEIRQFLQADRVGIFKFDPESGFDDGEFVSESVVTGLISVLDTKIHDQCFGKNFSVSHQQGRIQATDDIDNAGLEECYRAILSQFHVRGSLVVPLLKGEELWGLLCIHQCSEPRQWQPSEIDFTQEITNQLAIAIQQADLYEKMQSELTIRQQAEAEIALQLQRQKTLAAISDQIRESLDLNQILATVTQQVKEILQGDRVIIFRLFADGRSQIIEEVVANELTMLKNRHWDDEVWSQDILDIYWQGKPRIVPDVMNDIWTDCLVEYSIEGQIQSKIVAPILQEVHNEEDHRWIAPGETNKLWGVLVVHACREKRVWEKSEAELLQQIANHLSIAIQQAGLFEQLQSELSERQEAQQQLTASNQQLAISNQELARATRLKDEFLANMSHELRTPLNAILGLSEGLQEQVFGSVNNEQIKALQTIERSGCHLLELINDILDVAKIESGQLELDLAPTAISQLCQSSLAFIKQQALKKRIQLETKLPQNLPDLLVDERRILQVLINLLNNAVKFTPEGGHITLEVSRKQQAAAHLETADSLPQNYLRIAVIDTGIGIAPENINKLFVPFIQIDSALNRQYQGTGLGLALVKRIVELHGGQVGLTSEVGGGSCFTIDLPCATSTTFSLAPETQPQPGIESSQSEITSPLILLAEDNEANISTISSYLRAKGYRLIVAKNGLETIALTQSEHPDLILMDIQMPGMDGLEAMQHIRRDLNLVNVPIIALTALAMTGDRDRCLAAGANDYISKPVKLKQLATTIQQLLTPQQDRR